MKKIILSALLLSIIFPSFALAEQKAVLYFSSNLTNYTVGQKFNVSVVTDPKSSIFDTVRVIVKFPKDALSVQSVTVNPLFSVADPDSYYNNNDGIISYSAGIPSGTDKLSQFITISFLAKSASSATISFDSQSIVLNGGENVLSGNGVPLVVNITEPIKEEKPPVQNQEKPVVQNSQPKTTSNTQTTTAKEQKEDIENSGVASLSDGIVPIANQDSSGGLSEIISLRWLFIALLVILLGLITYYRKSIFLLIKKYTKNNKDSGPYNANEEPKI